MNMKYCKINLQICCLPVLSGTHNSFGEGGCGDGQMLLFTEFAVLNHIITLSAIWHFIAAHLNYKEFILLFVFSLGLSVARFFILYTLDTPFS